MNAQDSDGEADSLFGSRPPSPAPELNRGGSPGLALPGSPGVNRATLPDLPKNVGTIALPGSHNHSELLVSLPASPPRPQSAQPSRLAQLIQPHPVRTRFTQCVRPRASSLPATSHLKQKKKKKANSATSDHASHESTLAIPDTSNAPPVNFLRNQRALLGLAGVVGGVNPASLSPHGCRGATKQNPIVVEEETPSVNASSWRAHSTQLPANTHLPSSQAIADTLISQGNIFPVLRALMPYFGLNTNIECRSDQKDQQDRSHDQAASASNVMAPPLKRRKLNSVPAGAKDWDVPYPFPVNEGPRNYLESWQKKRGKKLMMQLVSLVREAVQKAVTKSQMQEDGSKGNERPTIDATQCQRDNYGKDNRPLSSSVTPGPITATTPVPDQQTMSSNFLDSTGINLDSASSFNSDFDSLLNAVNNALSDPNVQLTGTDLATMSSYPFSPAVTMSPTLTSSTRLSTPYDLTPPSPADKENDILQFQDFNFDDIPIDPSLLDLSWPDFPTLGTQNLQDVLSSPTSLEDVPRTDVDQATTPTTVAHDVTSDNFLSDPANAPMNGPSISVTSPVVQSGTLDSSVYTSQEAALESPAAAAPPPTLGQAQQQATELHFMTPTLDATIVRGKRVGGGPSSKKLGKQDVLRRARIRREQLAAETARAKIELWETTIEQGVLTHLSKDKELQPKT